MIRWTYNGREVRVSPIADITNALQMGSKYERLVQRALETVPAWEDGETPHWTITTNRTLWQTVTPNYGQMPQWGVHRAHRFQNVDVSPFLHVENNTGTRELTIELSGTPNDPVIERAYAGHYQPPLPWQQNVIWTPDSYRESLAFWRLFSYVYRERLVISPLYRQPPEWFLDR